MKKYIIFLNGEYKYSQKFLEELFCGEYELFCADGGSNYAYKINKIPKIIIGDLDSINPEVLQFYKSKNVNIEKFPRDKDFTDFELILEKVYKKKSKFEKVFVVGGIGNRIDMTLSNIFLMEKYENLVFLTENEEIFYSEKSFTLKNKKNYGFSIIPLSENIEKLTLRGFRYETDKWFVKRKDRSLVSNIITCNESKVLFEKGKMIIILQKLK